jgi:hypothetical protein
MPESELLHSKIMLYQFIIIVVIIYFKKTGWLCFKFVQNILISSVVKQHVFCGFLKNFISAAVILGFSYSSSV